MRNIGVGVKSLVFASLLAFLFVLTFDMTSVKAEEVVPGVDVTIEIFNLNGDPIFDGEGVQVYEVECWEPVRVEVTVDVDGTSLPEGIVMPIKVRSAMGEPNNFALRQRISRETETFAGRYWVMWRCAQEQWEVGDTNQVGARTWVYGRHTEGDLHTGDNIQTNSLIVGPLP